jgi:hypothetical protein
MPDVEKQENTFISMAFSAEERYKKYLLSIIKRKKIFRFKYPKLLLFVICLIGAYFLFNNNYLAYFVSHLGSLSYVGVFICGLLFSFGFTTPFAMAFLIQLSPENIYLAAAIGGFGAVISDLIIFRFIRFSFENEFKKLRRERPFLFLKKELNHFFGPKIENYLLFAFAGILFASPLPDEAAVMVLVGISRINELRLAIISYVFNSLGIFLLLLL